MADQRQPFRFRLPWAPPPAPAPARPQSQAPRQPTTAPSRPPFRPAGSAPAQPPPRTKLPTPEPTSPPKTEQPSTATEPQTTNLKQTSPLQPSKAVSKPSSSPSTTSVATGPRTTTPKPTSPQLARTPTSPKSPAASQSRAAYQPLSPSPSAARTKASPSTSKKEPSPIRENPQSLTMVDQSSSSKKEPEKLETQPKAIKVSENASESGSQATSPDHKSTPRSERKLEESIEVKMPFDEPIRKQNGEPKKKEVTELPGSDSSLRSETVVQPVPMSRGHKKQENFHRKEIITSSETSRKPAETFIPSYPEVSKPHNHKPAGEKVPLHKEIKEDTSKLVHKLGMGQGKQPLDGDKQLTVITLAGENRGASMTLSNEAGKRESSIHIHRGYRTTPDESVERSTDREESSKGRKELKDSKTDEEMPTKAYINSNVQGINNSLLFNGSVSTRNPGVQYVLSHNPEEHTEAYAPTVRRRCLRGLFLESSDSNPDNPGKPRRHGCPYGRKDKNKNGNLDVL